VAEIDWTAEAQRWLKEIHDYIAVDNPDAALRTDAALVERSDILSSFLVVRSAHDDGKSAVHFGDTPVR
jgi:hypothetical protein